MALALSSRPEIRLEVFLDERAASFAALGSALVTGTPSVALCTSGTAAVEFHPAAVEADHAGVPLVLLTADRPPELIGTGAAQTIDQRGLYGVSTRAYFDAGVADANTTSEWRVIARRAWSAAAGRRPGPVQVNMPFREPLVGTSGPLPPRYDDAPTEEAAGIDHEAIDALHELIASPRGVIVAGWGVDDPLAVLHLSARIGWPVLADPRSRCRDASLVVPGAVVVRHADPLLRVDAVAERLRPEAVLRLGEPPASKVVNRWLATSGARQIAVDPRGRLVDPDRVLDRLVHAPVAATCSILRSEPRDAEWSAAWGDRDRRAAEAIARSVRPLGEIGVARTLAAAMPSGSTIVASSSMPIRDLEWFADDFRGVRVVSNRGVNGIDGVLSTAIGVAVATEGPVALLIGDVALVHDSSAFAALARRGIDLRIVVVDNDGGGIFSFLPQAESIDVERFERIFGTPHGTDLLALAAAHAVPARACADAASFVEALSSTGPHLVLVRSDRRANAMEHATVGLAVAEALSN